MRRPAAIPLVHQPGEGWTYNTGAHILGVLLARLEGVPLGGVLADTVLEPLGVSDTGCPCRLATSTGRSPLFRRDHDETPLTAGCSQ